MTHQAQFVDLVDIGWDIKFLHDAIRSLGQHDPAVVYTELDELHDAKRAIEALIRKAVK